MPSFGLIEENIELFFKLYNLFWDKDFIEKNREFLRNDFNKNW